MADRRNGVVQWIRRLVAEEPTTAPLPEKTTDPELGIHAVESAEARISDVLCRVCGPDGPAPSRPGGRRNAFGTAVEIHELPGAVATLSAASGLAMSGLRTAVFLTADGLVEARSQLRAAVERHIPLVIHVTALAEQAAGIDAAARSGAFVLVARDAQHACDLALAARRAAERCLTPGVVVLDAAESAWTVQPVSLPAASGLRELLGNPEEQMEPPTPSQRLLFGERRRRVPRWFDPYRPLASGVRPAGQDGSAAVAANSIFFAAHVAEICDEALATLSSATGRPLAATGEHRLEGARHLIVASGPAARVAETVVASRDNRRVGVLELVRLSPLPEPAIGRALEGIEAVTVLIPREGADCRLQRVRAIANQGGTRVLSATFERLAASEVAAICTNMQAGQQARACVRLGVSAPAEAPEFPRRQALAQRVRRDYPEAKNETLPLGEKLDLRPDGSRTVMLRVRGPELPANSLRALVRALQSAIGPYVIGRSERTSPGVWQLCVTASPEPLGHPGAGLGADVALVAQPSLAAPFGLLDDGASVVVATRLAGAELWTTLPASWRRRIRDRGLRLFAAADGIEGLIEKGTILPDDLVQAVEEVPWRELEDPSSPAGPSEIPLAVERLGAEATGPESVARFWGELAQPRGESEPPAVEFDPYLALGTMPAYTASFYDAAADREKLPLVDPDRCTSCGKCWVSCPDSAIGAVALGPQALLDAASEWAATTPGGEADPAAGRLKRAHRQLGARWAGALRRGEPGAIRLEELDEAYAWLVETMKVAENERPAFQRAFEATRESIASLPFGTTAALFHDAEREKKDNGALLMLAIDSRSCQGCGVCSAVCEEDAIRMVVPGKDGLDRMRSVWRAWERLPDTPGALIARAAQDPCVGSLAAILLSRHCLFTLVGGDGAEPGSGERIAVRQVSAVLEYDAQRRTLALVERLRELATALRERIGDALSEAVSVEDLSRLDQALRDAASSHAPAGRLVSRLEELGEQTDVDVPAVRRVVRTARRLEEIAEKITRGFDSAGRARYGIVVTGRRTTTWATTFPRNPFGVPVTVDRTGNGSGLAQGLARGFIAERVREARLIRHAELLLEAPADLPARQRELDSLSWQDLTPEERALCSPLLVLADADDDGLDSLLSSGLPVKTVLLDSRDLRSPSPDPLLPAMALGSAHVTGTSLAHPGHLFECLSGALEFGGPALIRIHTPSPTRDGFPADGTVERARQAVETRVSPLVRFEPPAEGGLGRGLTLEGNPAPEEPWAHGAKGQAKTPAVWAEGEERYADAPDLTAAVGERARHWASLQELAGVAAPFADKLEARLTAELHDAHRAEIEAVRAEYEAKLREVEERQTRTQAAKLRERLMQLAGYRTPPAEATGKKKEDGP